MTDESRNRAVDDADSIALSVGQITGVFRCECGKSFFTKPKMRDHVRGCSMMPHIDSDGNSE